MKKVEFVVMLTSEDRYRHRHRRIKNTVVDFSLQYETKSGERWLAVVRYDTSHGFAHRDLFDRRGREKKTPVFARNLNEALVFADYDIKSNWRMYKASFIGGDPSDE